MPTPTATIQQVKPLRLFHRIRSNVAWSVISEIGGKGFLFLAGVYLARILEVENYGQLSYAQTVASYFWLAVDLGVNMYGPREIAREKEKVNSIANVLLTIRLVGGILVFVIFICGVYLLVSSSDKQLIFIGCAFYLISRSINTDWVFRGLEKIKYIAIGNFTTFFPMLLLMLIFVQNKDDAVKASFVWSLSYFLGGVISYMVLHKAFRIKYRPNFHLQKWKLHLKESMHFTFSGGLLTLYGYLPIIYLGIFALSYEVGLFSASYRLAITITYVISIIPISLYPIFSQLYLKDRPRFNKLHRYYQLFSLLVGIIVLVAGNYLAELIISSVYGMKYIESVPYFRILLLYIFFFCMRAPFGIVIAATGLQRYYTFASTAAVLFITVLFFGTRFIFHLSYASAASMGLAVTEFCMALMLFSLWKLKSD